MNVADLTALIRTGLDDAGKTRVPVVAPGTTIAVMPCVVLAPSDDALEDSNHTLRFGFDVTIVVHRNGQVQQYADLTAIEAIVVRSLIPSQVRFDGPFVFAATGGEATGEPAAMSRIIPVSFAADVTLC